ncbi:MAG: cell wall-binding repeat-containing protein [Peptococcaceae bacterium]|nr:cell wall-binding repeat-containing protein [Peptococcaceae bacterium]
MANYGNGNYGDNDRDTYRDTYRENGYRDSYREEGYRDTHMDTIFGEQYREDNRPDHNKDKEYKNGDGDEGNKNKKKKMIIIMASIFVVVAVAAVFLLPIIVTEIQKRLGEGQFDPSDYPDPAELQADYTLGDIAGRISGDAVDISLEVAERGAKQPRSLIIMPIYSDKLIEAFPVVVLAGYEKAPILLTPYDSLDPRVYAKIVQVRPADIYIAGGLTESVVSDIRKINRRTETVILKGKDKWDTAQVINSKLNEVMSKKGEGIKGAFILGGDAMGDAVTIASFAAANSYAIIPAKSDGTLPSGVSLPDENVYLIGDQSLVADIPGAQRLEGDNILKLNRTAMDNLPFEFETAVVINGQENFSVGVMVSPYAALRMAPVVLSDLDGTQSGVSPQTKDQLLEATCTLIGDQSKLSDAAQEGFALAIEIQEAMSRWKDWKPSLTFLDRNNIRETDHATAAYSVKPPYVLGTLSDAFVTDGLNMLNFARHLAGLPDDVTMNDAYSSLCKQASILLSYDFSRTPARPAEMTETFYRGVYQEGVYQGGGAYPGVTQSNIATGIPSVADSIREIYMKDPGVRDNAAVLEARRWILNPSMLRTGFGFVVADGKTYTALYSHDQGRGNAVDYEWIGWPKKNVFPIQFLGPTDPWSVSLNARKYRAARLDEVKVTLTEVATQKTWTFSAEDKPYVSSGKYFNVSSQSGLDSCIIFCPDGVTEYRGKYQVSITGVKDTSGQPADIEYSVMFYDMNQV